jgi:phage/plasmid-associated DNA primase
VKELPSIAVWAVAGWHALFGGGGQAEIIQPQSGQWDVQSIRDLSSDIKQYIDERCDFDPEFFVDKDTLYNNYLSWRQAQGRKTVTKAVFGKMLKTAFPQLDDYRPWNASGQQDDGRPRYYKGLQLQSPRPE